MKSRMGIATLLAAATAAFPAAAQERNVDLRVSFWINASHPIVNAITEWGKSIETASAGTIKVSTYPSEQLGKAIDHYDMVRDGIVEMAFVGPAYNAGRFPIWSNIEMPLTLKDPVAGAAAFREWYLPYAEKEMSDVKLCLVTMQPPGVFHTSKREIRSPSEVNGLKMRPGGALIGTWLSQMGATVIPAPLPEIRQVLERGLIDGMTFTWDLFQISTENYAKFHLDYPMYTSAQAWPINIGFYNSLSEKQKSVIDGHCNGEWSSLVTKAWADRESASREKLKASSDHVFTVPSDDDLKLWRDTLKPLETKLDGDLAAKSLDGAVLRGELAEVLSRHNAN